ncbi:MAG: tetratricopeptide repeat protein, partial [Gemmatirosa sp.]
HNLGMVYQYVGDERRAADAYGRAVQADPRSASTWVNLCDARHASGDVAGAWRALEEMARALPGHAAIFMETAVLAAAGGDHARAEQQLRALLAATPTNRRMQALGRTLLSTLHWSTGRVDDGDAVRREAIALDRRRGAAATALQGELALAMAAGWLRADTALARRRVAEALARQPLAALPPLDRPYLDLATALALGGETARARGVLAEYERVVPDATRRQDAGPHRQARGTIALVERRHADAIAELRQVPGPLCTVCGLPELGRAYEAAGRPDSARAVYARYASLPGLRRVDATDGFHRLHVLARLAALPPGAGAD